MTENAKGKTLTTTVEIAGTLDATFEEALNNAQSGLESLDSAASETSMDELSESMKNAADSAESASSGGFTVLKGVLSDLASSAIQSAISAIKDFATQAVQTGMDFTSMMSEVQAISGATDEELATLTETAREYGATTVFSASDAAEALKYMSLAGWDVEESISALGGVLDLAAASGMELGEASDMVTDYLSAFGMEASDASYFADMLAYAQSNSNTTAEQLGEAYQNCAANLNAAGQDVETTTSLLEAMANQGYKGSEAGTALAAVMRDITQNMSDGAIEIGDTTVAVSDAEGNFRDLTDILRDVEAATDGMGDAEAQAALQATFTSDSIKAVNMVMAEGIEKTAGYEEELRNASGTASEMAATMTDNLSGDLAELESAQEEMALTIYDYVEGPLRSVVQTATDIINGITDAISPQQDALDTFIDSIQESNDEIQQALENAESTMSGADSEIADLEAYKSIILELNDAEGKSEYQKYLLQSAVEALSGTVPELAEAWDDEASKIDLSSEAIADLIEQQEAYMAQSAALEAMEETYNALFEAQVNYQKALSAQETAQEQEEAAYDAYMKKIEEYNSLGFWERVGTTPNSYAKEEWDALTDASKSAVTANQALEESEELLDEATTQYNEMGVAVEAASEALNKSAMETDALGVSMETVADGVSGNLSSMQAMGTAMENIGSTAEETTDSIDSYTDATDESAEAAAEAAEAIQDAYDSAFQAVADAYNEAVESIQSQADLFSEFGGGEDMTVETMTANLQSQVQGITQMAEDIEYAKEMLGSDMSDTFLAYMESMGTEAANAWAHIRVTLENEGEAGYQKVVEMIQAYDQVQATSAVTAENMAADVVSINAALGELGSSAEEWTQLQAAFETAQEVAATGGAEVSQEAIEAFNTAAANAQAAGVAIPDGLAEGIASGETSVETATEMLNSATQGQLDALAQYGSDTGTSISTAVGEVESTVTAASSSMQAEAESAANSIQDSFASAMDAVYNDTSSTLSQLQALFASTSFSFNQNIALPHFSMSGSFNAETGATPSVSVSWYKEGGILTGATIFGEMGGSLLGGGEAGAEAVLPLETLWDRMGALLSEAFSAQDSDTAAAGKLLSLEDFSLSDIAAANQAISFDFSGTTYAPTINVSGNANTDDIMAQLKQNEADFFDWLEAWATRKEMALYG